MRRLVLSLLASAALAGCSTDFLPPSYLNDLRVLAVLADPLELQVQAGAAPPSIALRPVVYPALTAVADVAQAWTFCPVSAGSAAGYACVEPECALSKPEGPLPVGADGSIDVTPDALAACSPALGGSLPEGVPSPLTTYFRYSVTATTPAGSQSRVAVLEVPVWFGPPPAGYEINLPPAIQRVEIGTSVVFASDPTVPTQQAPPLAQGGSLPVHVVIDPASVQTYVDAAGVTRVETMTVDYYATAGRFASDSATGLDTVVSLSGTDFTAAELAAAVLQVYVVALDLRGGQAVGGPFPVTIAPP
ncbi:MAG TPA: hypothetical protein VMT17_07290 [Anaeromyxobacteraceae bacterium]|nr:hypothetical protein [Anaeromyxobacteraceae bacterium]